MYKMFDLQRQVKGKGDWATEVIDILHEFKIDMTLDEIKEIEIKKYKKLVKEKMKETAHEYLLTKQKGGSKGQKIKYGKEFIMADYLFPSNLLTVSEQKEIFSIRSRMNELPHNFGESELCETQCGETQTNEHIMICENLNNSNENKIEMEKMWNGSVVEKIEVLKRFKENMSEREKYLK